MDKSCPRPTPQQNSTPFRFRRHRRPTQRPRRRRASPQSLPQPKASRAKHRPAHRQPVFRHRQGRRRHTTDQHLRNPGLHQGHGSRTWLSKQRARGAAWRWGFISWWSCASCWWTRRWISSKRQSAQHLSHDRSHAPRGNASTDAPRSALERDAERPGCIPTRAWERSGGLLHQHLNHPIRRHRHLAGARFNFRRHRLSIHGRGFHHHLRAHVRLWITVGIEVQVDDL